MDRKQFIKTCGIACLGMSAMSAFLQSCSGLHYAAITSTKDKLLIIKKTEFEQTGKSGIKQKQFVLVKPENINFPVCVYALPDGRYSAVLLECTHNSCELQPRGEYLVCPCHGSEFSKLGIVQNPPAENNLKTFNVTSDHENIYLQL